MRLNYVSHLYFSYTRFDSEAYSIMKSTRLTLDAHHMTLKKKFLFFSLLCLLFGLFAFVAKYIQNIRYQNPINITITSKSNITSKELQIYGITPLGAKQKLDNNVFLYNNQENLLFSNVQLILKKTLLKNIDSITLQVGNDRIVLNNNDFVKLDTTKNNEIVVSFSNYIQDNPDLVSKLKSILNLSSFRVSLFILCLTILSFILVSKKLLFNFSRWFSFDLTLKKRIAVYFLCVLFGIFRFSNQSFSDKVWLGGDEWEYQSMAVNLNLGYGFPISGGLADSSQYRFYEDQLENGGRSWKLFLKKGGNTTSTETHSIHFSLHHSISFPTLVQVYFIKRNLSYSFYLALLSPI